MIKHVTEVQSIVSPILKAKIAELLDKHITSISELIDIAAKEGKVTVKMVLTEHTDNFYLNKVIPDYHTCDGYSTCIPKFIQIHLSNELFDLFRQQGYHYNSYDETINGFNVKYIEISWSAGLDIK